MNREQIEQTLLDQNITEAALDEHPELAAMVRSDPVLLECLREYDALRAVMRPNPSTTAETPDDGWAAMTRRMMRPLESTSPMRMPNHHRLQRIVAWAAIALVAAGGWMMFMLKNGGPLPVALDMGGKLALSEHDVAQTLAVFSRVTDTLDGKASWLVVSKNNADVGLSADEPGASRHLLLLRLSLLEDGRTVSQADVVIVAGQSATVTLPMDDGRQVRYEIGTTRTKTSGATRLSLWAQLQQRDAVDGEALAALATQLQPRAGQVLSAGEMVIHNDRYELRVSFGESPVKPVGETGDRS
ncbi:MAG: hypothetical protein ACYC26_04460 [Phycisphaerales bacterium]